jgi:translation initiation factor IF-3
MIRIPQVRVVDEDGSQLGVMPTPQALAMAQERGYDLVEVAPMAAPPVVRFLDFGQFKYEATKREKEAKRKQRSVTFKEVRLKPKIATGDFDTRVRRAIQFLEEGDRLKVAVQFRGRELTHPEIGRNLLSKFAERIKDHGVVERAPLLEGKSMHITVASTHKPKVIEGPKHEGGTAAADGAEPSPSAAPAADGAVAPEPAVAATAEPAKAAAPKPVAATEAVAAPEAVAAAEPAVAAEPEAEKAPKAKPATSRTKTATSAPAETPAATTDSPPSVVRAAPKRAPRTTRTTEPEAKAKAATTATTTGE